MAVICAGTSPDVERFLDALHALPDIGVGSGRLAVAWTTSREHQGVAFFSGTEMAPAGDAISHVSADTLSAAGDPEPDGRRGRHPRGDRIPAGNDPCAIRHVLRWRAQRCVSHRVTI